MKNVLITGGAGFIGSHLVDRLLAENEWNVAVLDDFNGYYSPVLKYHNIAAHSENRAFSLFGGDIISEQVLDGIFSNYKFDCIVHLADKTENMQSAGSSRLYERTNVHGTLNLLEAARANGVKQFVFGSSSSIYGNEPVIPFSEEIKSNKPISPYAATKAFGEMLCQNYSNIYGIRCVCLRFFTVYGPRQRPDMAVYRFADSIETGLPVTFYGDGTTERDYIYISDVVDGIRAAMDYDKSEYEIINLGTGRTVKLCELVKILEKSMNRQAVIERMPHKSGEMNITLAETKKARDLLGFDSKVPIEKGIETFTRWFTAERPVDESRSIVSRYDLADIVT